MPGLIPQGESAANLYMDAADLGAAPPGAIDDDTINSLKQQEIANSQQQQMRQRQLASWAQILGAGADDYTELNHGLQALPHIDNDE